MAESTKVNLTSKSLKETREFTVKHAEDLLEYQDKHKGVSDWEVDDPNYELKDGAITPTGKRPNNNATSKGGNTGSTQS
jgi:hypothetical protein